MNLTIVSGIEAVLYDMASCGSPNVSGNNEPLTITCATFLTRPVTEIRIDKTVQDWYGTNFVSGNRYFYVKNKCYRYMKGSLYPYVRSQVIQ